MPHSAPNWLAAKGAIWQFSSSASLTVVRIGARMILARILVPEDFGVFGLVYMVYELANKLVMSGMGAGLIAKTPLTQADKSTCFWTTLAIRCFVFLFLYLAAEILAGFLGSPTVSSPLRITGVVLLISGIRSTSQTLLARELKIDMIAKTNLITGLFESVFAVVLAYFFNLSYWSLIFAMLIAESLRTSLILWLAKWCPSLTFNIESFRYLINYGLNTLGNSLVSYFRNNIDYWIVTKLLGLRELAYYEFAYRLPHMISERISSPIGSTFYPLLGTIERSDTEISKTYLNVVTYVAWIIFPFFGGMIVTAHLIVQVLWGDQWIPVVEPFKILCIAAALAFFWWANDGVFLIKERPDIPLKLNIIYSFFTLIAVSLLGLKFGIIGVAWGMVISRLTTFFTTWLALKMIGSSIRQLLHALKNPAVCTILMSLIIFLVKSSLEYYQLEHTLSLLTCIIIGIVTYIVSIYLIYKDNFYTLKSMVFSIIKRNT